MAAVSEGSAEHVLHVPSEHIPDGVEGIFMQIFFPQDRKQVHFVHPVRLIFRLRFLTFFTDQRRSVGKTEIYADQRTFLPIPILHIRHPITVHSHWHRMQTSLRKERVLTPIGGCLHSTRMSLAGRHVEIPRIPQPQFSCLDAGQSKWVRLQSPLPVLGERNVGIIKPRHRYITIDGSLPLSADVCLATSFRNFQCIGDFFQDWSADQSLQMKRVQQPFVARVGCELHANAEAFNSQM